MNSIKKAHLALLFSNILFGLNFTLFSTIINSWLTFQQLFFSRVLFSALFFIPFILSKHRYKISFEDFLRLFAIALLIIFGKQYLMLWGVGYTSATDASILATFAPITTLMVSSWVVKEKLHFLKILGISISVSGVMIMILFGGFTTQGNTSFGNILILLSTISAATNTIMAKPVLMRLSRATVMGWYYIIGLTVTAPVFWGDFMAINISDFSTSAWIDISWVIILGTILPNYLLYYGTERATSVHTGLYYYMQPLTAIILSIFRDQFTYNNATVIGGIMILLSIVLIIIHYEKYKFPGIK